MVTEFQAYNILENWNFDGKNTEEFVELRTAYESMFGRTCDIRYPGEDLVRMSELETKAKEFATAAHARIGQKRKYSGEDYIVHPAEVAELVRSVPHTEEQLAAAWLHDTVEDTGVTFGEIYLQFGLAVLRLVEDLTDVSKPEHGNRAARRTIDLEHTRKGSPEAHTVKLADLISNSRSIIERDLGFAKVYLPEKARLLPVLRDGDPALYAYAYRLLEEGYTKLGLQI